MANLIERDLNMPGDSDDDDDHFQHQIDNMNIIEAQDIFKLEIDFIAFGQGDHKKLKK